MIFRDFTKVDLSGYAPETVIWRNRTTGEYAVGEKPEGFDQWYLDVKWANEKAQAIAESKNWTYTEMVNAEIEHKGGLKHGLKDIEF